MGNGKWEMGNGKKMLLPIPHSPLPIPHSPPHVFSTAVTRVVSRVLVVDCVNATDFDHCDARSGLGRLVDVDQGEYPVVAQRQHVARAVRVALAGKEESVAAALGDPEIAGAGVELQSAAVAVVLNTD